MANGSSLNFKLQSTHIFPKNINPILIITLSASASWFSGAASDVVFDGSPPPPPASVSLFN